MKDKIISFIWQHFLLLISLYVMTLGVAVCVRSQLGSSVISTIPYVMASAGKFMDAVPEWTIGTYTIVMNAVFVVAQILILRRNFEWVQLFQLIIGCFLGMFIVIIALVKYRQQSSSCKNSSCKSSGSSCGPLPIRSANSGVLFVGC